MRNTRPLIAGLLAFVVVLAPSMASADVVRSEFFRDANDTNVGMDIRRFGFVARIDPARWTFRFRTFERIHMPEDGHLYVHIDAFGGPKWDYGFHIQYDTGSSGLFCDALWRSGLHEGPYPERWGVSGSRAWCQLERFPKHDKPIRVKAWSETWPVIHDRAPDGGRWYP